jgi:hypothetical protein
MVRCSMITASVSWIFFIMVEIKANASSQKNQYGLFSSTRFFGGIRLTIRGMSD